MAHAVDYTICKGGPCGKKGVDKECGLKVCDNDKGVECDGCKFWYHSSCQKVLPETYVALNQAKGLFWICHECRKNLPELAKRDQEQGESKGNLSMSKKFEEKLDSIANTVAEQASAMKLMEESLKSMEELKQEKKDKKDEEKLDSIVNTVAEQARAMKLMEESLKSMEELKLKDRLANWELKVDREDRATNLLIHNVPESKSEENEKRKEEDLKQFEEIAEALGGTDIEIHKLVRLRRKNEGKPRIILVRLGTRQQADLLYNRRFNLKSRGFENTYITRDLPPKEREEQRKLREEWKEKGRESHVIYRGKVVERRR